MKKLLNAYISMTDVLEKISSVFVITSLIVMTVLMTVQTIMRYFFATGLTWSEELTRFICCYSVMIASSIAIRHGRHLNMGFIADKLKGRSKYIYKLIIGLVCLAFYVYILVLSIKLCRTVTGTTVATNIPFGYVYMCLPIGIVLMMITEVEQALLTIWAMIHNEEFVRIPKGGKTA